MIEYYAEPYLTDEEELRKLCSTPWLACGPTETLYFSRRGSWHLAL